MGFKQSVFVLAVVGAFASSAFALSDFSFIEGKPFRLTKSSTSLVVIDQFGPRTLKIQNCNRAKVDAFWKKLEETTRTLAKVTSAKDTKPAVVVDSKRRPLAVGEPHLPYLRSLSAHTYALVTESKVACR